MKRLTRSRLLAGLVGLALGCALLLPSLADGLRDHDRARAALKAGEILPLQTVLDSVQRTHPGQVLDVELEREDGRWIYEIKLLQGGGRMVRLDVDARTAAVLRSRSRHAPEAKAAASAPEPR